MSFFIIELFKNPTLYISIVLAFMVSICFHEFCHATVAHQLGDDTARKGGFQTMNPFKVMGWKSIVCLLLFGFSWGAVPVLPDDKKRFRRFAISISGPLSNLLLMGVLSLLLEWLQPLLSMQNGVGLYVYSFFLYALYANVILFLFNIMPIPPLDGWGALESFLPKRLVPSPGAKSKIFLACIYIVCFSSASGFLDKGIDSLYKIFAPASVAAQKFLSEGCECLENGELADAFEAFSKAAEKGSVEGRFQKALCLAYGLGCELDMKKAFPLLSDPEVFSLNSDARFLLGYCYYAGEGVSQDFRKAAEHIKAAADVGNDEAKFMLGYKDGKFVDDGTTLDARLKLFWDIWHYFDDRLCKEEPVGKAAIVERYRLKAEKGNVVYQLAMGNCYMKGEGVEKDMSEAVEWYRKAADQGNAPAQYRLGKCYEKGNGVWRDERAAKELYNKAAEQGYAAAKDRLRFLSRSDIFKNFDKIIEGVSDLLSMIESPYIRLGIVHLALFAVVLIIAMGEHERAIGRQAEAEQKGMNEGIEHENSSNEARTNVENFLVGKEARQFLDPAEKGDADAQYNLGEYYYDTEDEFEAVKWYRKAAEQGHAAAQCKLGDCHYWGRGVAEDEAEAVNWWRKAAEQGHAIAQCRLGDCYTEGRGVMKDAEEAANWYRLSGEQGNVNAQICLGTCYANGNGVAQDKAESVKWWLKAAEQGSSDALCRLGVCYLKGEGVEKDYDEAAKYLRKAAERGNIEAAELLETKERVE